MGIPGLARTLEKSANYRKHKVITYELKEEIDHLLFDFNGIVYTIEGSIKDKYVNNNKSSYEKLLISEIIKYLQQIICEYIKPKQSVFISIDGPVPRAKISEQRKRRHKTLIKKKLKNKIKKDHDISIKESWNASANMIPGTIFMSKLEKELKKAIKNKIFFRHQDITVILSSGNVPGEGEHKILPIIRKLNKNKKKKNDKICIFSPDGDFIVLALILNKKNVYLLDNFKDEDHVKQLHKFKFTNIDNYRKALTNYVRTKIDIKQFSIDYNLMMCFLGNDFVKNFIITSSKNKDSLEKIILPQYEGLYYKFKKPLQELKKDKIVINHIFLRELLRSIGKNEDFRFKKYYEYQIEKCMLGKTRERKDNKPKTPYEKDISILEHTPICDPKNKYLYKTYVGEFRKIDYSLPYNQWREQYYKYYFDLDISKSNSRKKLVEIVYEYLKSLVFVQYYYLFGCPSWSWYYRYETTPLPSDIASVMSKEIPDINKITFEKSEPYTPIQQLMFVMPLELVKQLPESKKFKKLMMSKKYKHLYPTKFDLVVTLGIKFVYSSVELPPFDDSIVDEIKKIENDFKENAKKRNLLTYKLYKKDCSKLNKK